jgi:predicted PurR-regulated permease PerM
MASRPPIRLNRGMETRESRRVELVLPLRTVLLVVATLAVLAAFAAIGDTFLVIFVGVFLALVFEFPVRFVMAKTGLSRGVAATVTVLGAAVAVTLLALLFLVRLVGSVRDFLKDLPSIVAELRESDELSFLGDTAPADNVEEGAENVAAWVPDAISAMLGLAGAGFTLFIAAFTILFTCLFLLSDIGNMKRTLASVLTPGEEERWLAVWERVTESVSRWAIGLIVIATIAGTTQGLTAWLLGSSYAVALGVIAGLLDMIPNIGATLAGFILVPVILAEEGLTAALIMLAVVLIYQQVENNLVTPKIQGRAVHLSGFFIIVSVTLFGALLGVLGALTAVPLAATIQIFVQELTKTRREQVAAAKAALEPAAVESLPGGLGGAVTERTHLP